MTIPHRRSSTVLGLLPPAAMLIGATLLCWSWRDELPDQIASHFGANGQADEFSSLTSFLAIMLGIFGAVAIGGWLIAVLLGRDSANRRMGVGVANGMTLFGVVITVGIVNASRGLTDPSQVSGIDRILLIALLIALIFGVAAAAAVPGDRKQVATGPIQGIRMPLDEGERAVWTTQMVSTPSLAIGGGAVLLIGVLTVALRQPFMLLITLLLLGLLSMTSVLVVTVDANGLEARSTLGWPRRRIPANEITGVEVAEIHPLREFGGYGFRVGRGGETGWVLRTGEGIRVHLSGGRGFVVTVPDAATGAALLTTVAERAWRLTQ